MLLSALSPPEGVVEEDPKPLPPVVLLAGVAAPLPRVEALVNEDAVAVLVAVVAAAVVVEVAVVEVVVRDEEVAVLGLAPPKSGADAAVVVLEMLGAGAIRSPRNFF